jgi:hypothetical protein
MRRWRKQRMICTLMLGVQLANLATQFWHYDRWSLVICAVCTVATVALWLNAHRKLRQYFGY